MELITCSGGISYSCAFGQAGVGVRFAIGTTNRIVIGGTDAFFVVVTSSQQQYAGNEEDKGFHGGR